MKRVFAVFALVASLIASAPADAATIDLAASDGVSVVQTNNGDLTIEGTDGDDGPIVVSAAENGVAVWAGDGEGPMFSGPIRNLTVALKDGADSLTVDGATLPSNLTVIAGGDGDQIMVDGASVAGVTTINMGTTTGTNLDLAYLLGSSFGSGVTVSGASGFNGVIVDSVAIDGNLNVLTDGGASVVDIDGSAMAGLQVSGGRDGDNVTIANSSIGDDPTILTRGGHDAVVVQSTSFDGTAKIDTDSGDDYIDFFPGSDDEGTEGDGHDGVRLDLRSGSGNDTIEADAAWDAASLVNGGPGSDSFEGSSDGLRLINVEEEIPGGTARNEMVVTANPIATDAGALVLRRGGSAVDAMVAAQSMLGLVEPQSSGIGGGAFVVYYDAATGETTTFDAREKAPAAATGDRFEGLGFFAAWQTGLSVGVPGVPKVMDQMHDQYGTLPKAMAYGPALAQAIKGFEISGRTSSQVGTLLGFNASCEERSFFRDPVAFEYFANPDCSPKAEGTLVRNIDFAETMVSLQAGSDAFYNGEIAANIAAAVQSDLGIAGDMTTDDLAAYTVEEREPVCVNYRGHEVCGMGPPSSGGITVGQTLGILESFDLGDDPLGEDAVHLFTQAGRLSFADRNFYIGDSDFVSVPVAGMLDPAYLAERAGLITDQDMGRAEPGVPPGASGELAGSADDQGGGTSHISIVDQWGNALSMTTSVESSFGNGVMVDGFLLNNQLTDFSFSPTTEDGMPIANRVQPGKRPRSSMSPTIVMDGEGAVKLVTGSPGGSRIIAYTAQSIINTIDFGLDPADSVRVPHFINRNGSTDIEAPGVDGVMEYDADARAAALEARGHSVNVRSLTSGLSMILIDDGELKGGADPRRDGTVGGRSQ